MQHQGVGQCADDAPHVRLRDRVQTLTPHRGVVQQARSRPVWSRHFDEELGGLRTRSQRIRHLDGLAAIQFLLLFFGQFDHGCLLPLYAICSEVTPPAKEEKVSGSCQDPFS